MDTTKLATYLVNMCKGNNRSIEYCIGIVPWYTMTEKQDDEVVELIKKYW